MLEKAEEKVVGVVEPALMKAAKKLSQKKKRKNTNRAPSGFVKPTLISGELAAFLEKPTGTEMARTEVTREINKYIRAHDLQDD